MTTTNISPTAAALCQLGRNLATTTTGPISTRCAPASAPVTRFWPEALDGADEDREEGWRDHAVRRSLRSRGRMTDTKRTCCRRPDRRCRSA